MRIINSYAQPFLTHTLAWFCFAGYEQSIFLIAGNSWPKLPYIILQYALNAALFYLNAVWLLPLCNQHRYAKYGLLLASTLAIYAIARGILYTQLAADLHDPAMPAITSYKNFAALSVYRGTFFVFTSAGYWLALKTIEAERFKLKQAQQLNAAENRAMEINLSFLRSQINPHFLFNTLNFLYAQIYPHSAVAAKGILLLAETMNYAIGEDIKGKVMLTHEIQHLRNYIAIQQLRFDNRLQIDFTVIGTTHFLVIPPLILLTFIENCFKHGELENEINPLLICLKVEQNNLFFSTYNRKRYGPKEKSTGIGLANIIQRLDSLYQDRYNLTIIDELNYYNCTLHINL